MNNHSIGFNVIGTAVKDESKLLTILKRIQPRWMLVMNNIGLAIKIADLGIQTIYRHFPDNNLNDLGSPSDFIRFRESLPNHPNLWHYTTNEIGLSNEMVQWHLEVINNSSLKLVICNHSVGTPEENEYSKYPVFMESISKHSNKVVLGLHEYSAAIITSGLVGGEPTLINPLLWPSRFFFLNNAAYHCGRYRMINDSFKQAGLKLPRIVITEHGFDNNPDVDRWLKRLELTNGYQHIRGYKTLEKQWSSWFASYGWDLGRSYYEQVNYAANTFYSDSNVEGQLLFCYGSQSNEWNQFDIEGLDGLINRLGNNTPIPIGRRAKVVFTVTKTRPYINVRSIAGMKGKILAILRTNNIVDVFEESIDKSGNTWVRIESGKIKGWISLQNGTNNSIKLNYL